MDVGLFSNLTTKSDRNHYLEAYVSEQSINNDVVVACIDTFFPTVARSTVIVVESESIHTSDAFFDRLEEWTQRGLTIFE